jgi:ABC-type sugar transport system ATPase subunit
MSESTILRAQSINKNFGAVVALKNVSLSLRAGEITGLVGDNGAGKSTLVKLISGVNRPDQGTLEFEGNTVEITSPAKARTIGIETVYQDLALAGNMTVWANVFLGREISRGPSFLNILDKPTMIAKTLETLERFEMNVPPIDKTVESLSGGQRQLIAIARAATWGSKLIIMDEPTAALGVAETQAVEKLIDSLKQSGFSLLVISHNLNQVFRITDRIWVLRRGEVIGERVTKDSNPEEIVSLITGAIKIAKRGE